MEDASWRSSLGFGLILTALVGCATRAPIVDIEKVAHEAVLFDTVVLDPNHRQGVFVSRIDRLNPYAGQASFRRLYGDPSRNSLAWVMAPGHHELTFTFHDSATILGKTAKAKITVEVELAGGGLYLPEADLVGEEVEWRIFDRRSGRVTHGPWRSQVSRGTTFNLNPARGSEED